MAGTPTFPLYDQVVNGRLEVIIQRYRSEGMGSRRIAKRLAEDHGINPSDRTVARWLVGEAGAPKSLKDEVTA